MLSVKIIMLKFWKCRLNWENKTLFRRAHNILLFVIFIKERPKLKQSLRVSCHVSYMNGPKCSNQNNHPYNLQLHTSCAQSHNYGEEFFKHSLSHHTLSTVLAKVLHSRNYENACQTLTVPHIAFNSCKSLSFKCSCPNYWKDPQRQIHRLHMFNNFRAIICGYIKNIKQEGNYTSTL